MQPVGLFRCHPNSSPPHNPSLTNIPVPIGGGVALAYPPPPADVFQHPIGRHVRLPSSPDSGGHWTGCRGDSVMLRSPGNTPLRSTDGLVAQTRWGNPQGHVPGVRFATREPAPVVQLVVQSPCRDQYELAESLKNTGQRGGDFTSPVRQSFQWLTLNHS